MQGRWGLIPPVEEHYDTFNAFQRQCDYISRMLLDRISNALGLGSESSLNRTHRGDCPSKSAVAYIHYIPTDPTGENAGQNMHTDYGTLTLVFTQQWGLQVLFPSGPNGEHRQWQWVEPRPGYAIVNVGDVLHFLTGRKLISAVHRVLPLADEHRYSVTYFLRPSDDTEMTDMAGKVVNVMDWYTIKNRNYEASPKTQDKSFLVGGLYKDKFETVESTETGSSTDTGSEAGSSDDEMRSSDDEMTNGNDYGILTKNRKSVQAANDYGVPTQAVQA